MNWKKAYVLSILSTYFYESVYR